MYVHRIVLFQLLVIVCTALAVPIDINSSPDHVFGDSIEPANTSSTISFPSDISYLIKFQAGIIVDARQAQGLMLVAITKLAAQPLDQDLPLEHFSVRDEYPRVRLQIGPEGQQHFTARYAVWGLLKMLEELDKQRGDDFVSTGFVLYKQDARGGSDAIGSIFLVSRQTTNEMTLNTTLPFDRHLQESADSTSLTRRDGITASSNFTRDGVNSLAVTDSTDDLAVQFSYLSTRTIGLNHFSLALFNAVFQLTEAEIFSATRPTRFDVTEYGTSLLINPPDPPRTSAPMNSKVASIRVIARFGALAIYHNKFDEAQADATLRGVQISTTSIRKL